MDGEQNNLITIYECQVPCLSLPADLQRLSEKLNLRFSKDTNKHCTYLTLKRLRLPVAQKIISRLVEKGEAKWKEQEEFEVEQIIDYQLHKGEDFYLIKWKGWSHSYDSWEPSSNLDCKGLLQEFHVKNNVNKSYGIRAGMKRKFEEIPENGYDRRKKRATVEQLLELVSCDDALTPLKLISHISPEKQKQVDGPNNCFKVPKFNTATQKLLNPRTKAYKEMKEARTKALKDWEKHLNDICSDPAPISVVNDEDLEGPPENFIYINDYKYCKEIVIPEDPIIGCECQDCINNKECCAAQNGVEFAYYKHKRVRIDIGRPIFECNKKCLCGADCPNRVVQQGRKHKVCIFRTNNGRGWGVKAMQRIKKGTFVMEYVGEVISNEEAEIRGKTYDRVGRTYLFDLDFNGDDNPYTVDAAVYGNISHFVNHSCEPNMKVYCVWINNLNPSLPRIALFSSKDIQKGEELTIDYLSSKVHTPLEEEAANDDDTSSKMSYNDDTDSKMSYNDDTDSKMSYNVNDPEYRMVCQCGSKKCRKFLF